MGCNCGKQSRENDPFASPGRTLSSAPPPASGTARVPRNAAPHSDSLPGRTLGGRSNTEDDARRAAASAAEERATAGRPKGKLGNQLQSQRQQTRTNTLEQASRDERRHRDANEATDARNWD
ncbi:MAG: hypothetical protein M1833_007394 [Piccolia ochrophora]|nr:MAG: hypothetical protein M1833_007394 [Piccolia ochrophora]